MDQAQILYADRTTQYKLTGTKISFIASSKLKL